MENKNDEEEEIIEINDKYNPVSPFAIILKCSFDKDFLAQPSKT